MADLGFCSSVHMTDSINRAKGARYGVWHVGDMPPQENVYFRPSEIAFGAVLG